MTSPPKCVDLFSSRCTEGQAAKKNLLGGRRGNLAEMCRLGVTVPAGFTIGAEACTVFTAQGRAVAPALTGAEALQGIGFLALEPMIDRVGAQRGVHLDTELVAADR